MDSDPIKIWRICGRTAYRMFFRHQQFECPSDSKNRTCIENTTACAALGMENGWPSRFFNAKRRPLFRFRKGAHSCYTFLCTFAPPALFSRVFPGFFYLAAARSPWLDRTNQDWAKEELAWRAQHVADLQKPDGWLSLIGLEWLQPGETTLGSASDNKIHLPASAAAHLAVLKLEHNVVHWLLPTAASLPVCK